MKCINSDDSADLASQLCNLGQDSQEMVRRKSGRLVFMRQQAFVGK